jgi:cyclopropane fatty-acyl-phospholipid synthase-like methyltransferase
MGDEWFGIAGLDHFWCLRRFEVLRRMADGALRNATHLAEIGCGSGIVQRQIEDAYAKQITGFDLNENALVQNISRISEVCCYDAFQKNPEYADYFEGIVLFDVLEHLEDEDGFLAAVQFHLAQNGKLIVNVPAFEYLFSRYDEAAGHFRRHDIGSLTKVAERNGMTVTRWTYWGMALTPLLVLRKYWLLTQAKQDIIASGMDSRGPLMNRMLLGLSRLEPIPQHSAGTSLMAILEKN